MGAEFMEFVYIQCFTKLDYINQIAVQLWNQGSLHA